MRTVHLVEVCKPMSLVWSVESVCGADDLAQGEKERLEKRYPANQYRVRKMTVQQKSRARL